MKLCALFILLFFIIIFSSVFLFVCLFNHFRPTSLIRFGSALNLKEKKINRLSVIVFCPASPSV